MKIEKEYKVVLFTRSTQFSPLASLGYLLYHQGIKIKLFVVRATIEGKLLLHKLRCKLVDEPISF